MSWDEKYSPKVQMAINAALADVADKSKDLTVTLDQIRDLLVFVTVEHSEQVVTGYKGPPWRRKPELGPGGRSRVAVYLVKEANNCFVGWLENRSESLTATIRMDITGGLLHDSGGLGFYLGALGFVFDSGRDTRPLGGDQLFQQPLDSEVERILEARIMRKAGLDSTKPAVPLELVRIVDDLRYILPSEEQEAKDIATKGAFEVIDR